MPDANVLKQEILDKVSEYYQLVHKPLQDQAFVPDHTRVNYAGRVFDETEMVCLVDSALEFWLTQGRYTEEFEKKLADWLGIKYALMVNSGSSANLLAFMALTSPLLDERRVNRGDEVITVATAFPTTVAPIVQYGAVPVFVDVELETANCDVSLLEGALSEKTKAVMLAHTLGNPFDIEVTKEFCNKHNLWLIEDNCDALGSLVNGKLTGTFGDIGTSSFYPPHHLTTGEGGAVYTSNQLLKKIMLSLRGWGRDCWCASGKDNSCGSRFSKQCGSLPFGYDHKYVYSHWGYNLKATDMQAAIGVAQLDKVDNFSKVRKENHNYLKSRLESVANVIKLPRCMENVEPSWFGFMMLISDSAPFPRNEIVEYLESHGIQTRNLFSGNITYHPLFDSMVEGLDYRVAGELKSTNRIMNNAFWVGVYPGMSKEKLDYMVDKILGFIASFGVVV